MAEEAVFVVVEVLSVEDPAGFQRYVQQAGALIGARGGEVVGQGNRPIDDEPGFGPLVIQRWRSESALRAWFESEEYKPLNTLRQASATMRVTIVPVVVASGSCPGGMDIAPLSHAAISTIHGNQAHRPGKAPR